MHPLHAHLYAMDGSRAYLVRLLEFEAEYHAAYSPEAKATVRDTYQAVRANFRQRYPHLTPPDVPACLA